MKVSKKQWDQSFELILDELRKADLVSFDTELTGLYSRQPRVHMEQMDLDFYYWAIEESVNTFSITQLGLSLFNRNPTTKE